MGSAIIQTSDALRLYAATDTREPMAQDEFRERFSSLLGRAPRGLVREHMFFSLPSARSAWLDTGIDCESGEAVTVFATSRTGPPSVEQQISSDQRLWDRVTAVNEARRGVWLRVGADGEALRGPRTSHTFVTSRSGRLFLASQMSRGSVAVSTNANPSRIDRSVLVIRWAGDPLEGLELMRAVGDVGGMLASEVARQQTTIPLTRGWRYPPDRPSEEYAVDTRPASRPIIGCHSRNRGARLMKDVTLPFLPDTRLRWEWKVDRLPSRVREDRLHTHDYLSIAVEFNNGRDITYHWSAELPAETAYPCPVPGWENRETHIVVRSGMEGLGQWFGVERDLHADYARYVGEPPSEIVCVWLLAVTFLQGGEGQCDYGLIEIENGAARQRVN